MEHQPETCPQCGVHLADNGAGGWSFCPNCRFPLMLVAGKYRLEKVLAEGGFSVVYLAHHVDLIEQKRVIKVIKPEIFAKESVSARFRREVRVTSALSEENPHIVQIFDDFGEQPNLGHYYVMEHLKGHTLKSVLTGGALPVPMAMYVFRQLCQAIGPAHQAGIAHRDLKPDNIFLTKKGQDDCFVKVIDFGIAKPTEGGTQMTKGVIGTPYYMSPEQSLGKPVDERSDIYSMGVILYEMLAGTLPYTVEHDEDLAWLMAHVSHEPIPLQLATKNEAYKELNDVVMVALHKVPDQRFPSVEAFWEALLPFVTDEALANWESMGTAGDALGVLPTGVLTGSSAGWQAADALSSGSLPGAMSRDGLAGFVGGPVPSGMGPAPSVASETLPPAPSSSERPGWFTGVVIAIGAAALLAAGWLAGKLFSKPATAPVTRQVKMAKSRPLPSRRKRPVVVPRPTPRPAAGLVAPRVRPVTRNNAPVTRTKAPTKRRTRVAMAIKRRIRRKRRVRRRRIRRRYRRKRRILTRSTYRGNIQRTGYYPTRPVTKKPKVKWTFRTNGVGVSSPIVAHDYVYIGNNQKQIFAINYDTGGLAWTKKTRKWASRRSWSWTTMSVSGNRLFVVNGSSELFILHAKRGTTIDTISSRGAISRAPVVFKRHLFFTDSRNSIYAYDHFTNTKLWYKWMRGGDIRHGVAIDGDLVVHGHVDDYVYARALTTGKIFWYTKLGSDVAANPVIAYRYKMVIAGDARGGMHGLSIVDGKSKWSHTTPGGIYWSPAFGRGVAIFSSSKGRLIAIRVKTGKVLWKTGAGVARTPVSIAGSYVYYGTRSNKLVARSLWSGKTIWSYALSGLARSAPVIDHGTVFIHTNDGVLHALTQP